MPRQRHYPIINRPNIGHMPAARTALRRQLAGTLTRDNKQPVPVKREAPTMVPSDSQPTQTDDTKTDICLPTRLVVDSSTIL